MSESRWISECAQSAFGPRYQYDAHVRAYYWWSLLSVYLEGERDARTSKSLHHSTPNIPDASTIRSMSKSHRILFELSARAELKH